MKSEKFKLLAEKRTNNAIKQIRLIGNLANPNSYEYSKEQVCKIMEALDAEVKSVQRRFDVAAGAREAGEFTL